MSDIGASSASFLKRPSVGADGGPPPSAEARIPQQGGKKKPVIRWVVAAVGVAVLLGTAYVALEYKPVISFRADAPLPEKAVRSPDLPVPGNMPAHAASPALSEPALPGRVPPKVAPPDVPSQGTLASVPATPAFTEKAVSPNVSAPIGQSRGTEIRELQAELAAVKSELSAVKAAADKPRVVYRTIVRTVTVPAKPKPAPKPKPPVTVLGAANGVAWVSVHGQREQVQPGDSLPGIGVIQNISPSGVIHGSNGVLR